MVGTFEVDMILDAFDINRRRPSVGETKILMPYCIVSEGVNDSSTEID